MCVCIYRRIYVCLYTGNVENMCGDDVCVETYNKVPLLVPAFKV